MRLPEDAPRARHGFKGSETNTTRNNSYLAPILESVKLSCLPFYKAFIELFVNMRFSMRRSLLLDRTISAIEGVGHD